MKEHDEQSYERYKQYRLNRDRYEQDQKLPFIIIIILALLSTVWHYILFALILFVIGFVLVAIYKGCRKKEMSAKQLIPLKML